MTLLSSVLLWPSGCRNPAPSATLGWVSEAAGSPAAVVSGIGDAEAVPVGPLGTETAQFPGPPDPRGTHLLVVTSEDRGESHTERMWLVPRGGGPGRMLAEAQLVRSPSFLPDGSGIVYESDARSFRDLYRVSRDGGEPVRLTETELGTFEPAVSADGRWMAFASSRDGNAEIYVSRPDGAAPRRITDHPADDTAPAFLPDGRLSWISTRDGRPAVWIADLSGAHAHPLRQPTGQDLAVVWSSQGIAAVTSSPGPTEVRLELLRDDGTPVAVLDGPGPDEHPSFSPDGAWLAFSSAREDGAHVWIARADGSGLQRVSRAGPAWLPRWLVDPAR